MQLPWPLKSLIYTLILLSIISPSLLAQKSVEVSQRSFFSVGNDLVAEHTSLSDSVKNILLEEVHIKNKQKSPKDKLQEARLQYRDAYTKGSYDKHLKLSVDDKTMAPKLSLVNLDAAYKQFSKSGKNARKLQRSIQYDYEQAEIDHKYTSQLVRRLTGLKGEELVDFMQQNRPTYTLINQGADYDLIIFIKKNYAAYCSSNTLLSDLPLESK